MLRCFFFVVSLNLPRKHRQHTKGVDINDVLRLRGDVVPEALTDDLRNRRSERRGGISVISLCASHCVRVCAALYPEGSIRLSLR